MAALTALWVESYRPATVDDYVFCNDSQKEQVNKWITTKSIPHLLFSGAAGTGKTTLAKILINSLDIHPYDLLEINASRENSVDAVRNRISNFVETMPFGHIKIVFLDEFDHFSINGQAALRGLMESQASTARFILTGNYPHKIIPAIHSRCQGFHIEKIDHTEFTARIATVLMAEKVEFDLDILDSFVKATYPDLRKCINLVQMNSVDGKLMSPSANDVGTADYKLATVDLLKKGKIREARQLMCSQARPDEMDEIFSWAYNNLDLWSDTPDGQDQAILIIRDALANASLVADPEINLSACLIELTQIGK